MRRTSWQASQQHPGAVMLAVPKPTQSMRSFPAAAATGIFIFLLRRCLDTRSLSRHKYCAWKRSSLCCVNDFRVDVWTFRYKQSARQQTSAWLTRSVQAKSQGLGFLCSVWRKAIPLCPQSGSCCSEYEMPSEDAFCKARHCSTIHLLILPSIGLCYRAPPGFAWQMLHQQSHLGVLNLWSFPGS